MLCNATFNNISVISWRPVLLEAILSSATVQKYYILESDYIIHVLLSYNIIYFFNIFQRLLGHQHTCRRSIPPFWCLLPPLCQINSYTSSRLLNRYISSSSIVLWNIYKYTHNYMLHYYYEFFRMMVQITFTITWKFNYCAGLELNDCHEGNIKW